MENIPGYEGIYSVCQNGHIFSHISKRRLNPTNKKGWYLSVRLCRDGVQRSYKVHRLIAMVYLGNPNGYKDINHKNGIKTDNRRCNLEWCSRSQNIKHSYEVLKRNKSKGKTHPKSKTVIDLSTGVYYDSIGEAAEAKGLTRHQIKSGIRKKGIYQSLSYA